MTVGTMPPCQWGEASSPRIPKEFATAWLAIDRTSCSGKPWKGRKDVILSPWVHLPPLCHSQGHPTAPSQHQQPDFQLGTQLSLLLASQFPHSVDSRAVTPRAFQILLCLLPLCHRLRPRGFPAAAGAQRCSAALSRETRTAAGGSLRNRQNWELSASSRSPAGKRGFPPQKGVPWLCRDLPDPFHAARGWDPLSGNHSNDERHHGLLV